jgi:hypothetical protein
LLAPFLWQAAEKAFQNPAWRENLSDPAEYVMASPGEPETHRASPDFPARITGT